MDLETIATGLSGLGQVRLRPGACIREKSPWSQCRRCLEACPAGGIVLGKRQPVIRECQRCGLCAVACPAGVLEDPERTHTFFLARGREAIAATGQAVFACNQVTAGKRNNDLVYTPCLGAVAPEVMVALAGMGRVVFLYSPARCSGCPWGEKGERIFRQSFRWAQETLEATGIPGEHLAKEDVKKITSTATPQGSKLTVPVAMGRREFFRSLVRGIKIPGTAATKIAAGSNSPPAGRRRAIILHQALQEARPAGGYASKALLPLASLELAGPCYLCNICSRLCPSGALELTAEALQYTPAYCNHCDLCLTVCPQHSLVRGQKLSPEMIASTSTITMAIAGEYTCTNCGENFRAGTGATMCLRCYLAGNFASGSRAGEGAV